MTLDGGGFTISATDASYPGTDHWNGAIVTNAGPTMNIQNVTIAGPDAGFKLCVNSGNVLYGIYFNDASGTVSNVTVDNIFQFQNGLFASCQTGRAIRSDGVSPGRTLTITGTTVTDYQKSGFEARGTTNLNLSGSTAGPPSPMEGLIAQNAVSLVGVTTGTIENNTIHGSSDQAPFPGCAGLCAGQRHGRAAVQRRQCDGERQHPRRQRHRHRDRGLRRKHRQHASASTTSPGPPRRIPPTSTALASGYKSSQHPTTRRR